MIRVRPWHALLALACLAASAVLAASCGGSASVDSAGFPKVQTLGECKICPDVRNTGLAVGPNRVIIGLTDENSRTIENAKVHARFYDRNGAKPVLKGQGDATYEPVQLSFVNEDDNNKTEVVGNDGVYIVNTTFDSAGNWGVFLDVTQGGKTTSVPFIFTVRDKTSEPEIGDAAPASRQIIASNVSDISQIDSSYPPRTAMHQITIADALKTGKPVVVAFATPAFCTSRLCAPIMDTVMDPLSKQYAGQAIFIHVEPYDLSVLRQTGVENAMPVMREWGLQSEPWIFVVDTHGKIAAKFEGVATAHEVGQALEHVLPGAASGAPSGAPTAASTAAR